MRQIPLKHIHSEPPFDYRETLEAALFKSPQEGGVTYESLRHYEAIEAALKAGQASVLLEEADWTFLVNRLKGYRWAMYSPHLRSMIDDIASAESVKVAPQE